MCENEVGAARFGAWIFYTFDIFSIFLSMVYSWVDVGEDALHLIDAIILSIIFACFIGLGYYSVYYKRDYFNASQSDWATDLEMKCMWIACLPTGLVFRNWSADSEMRNYTTEFECYFWKNYTIFKGTTSCITILLALINGFLFFACFIAILFGLYYWAYYTLKTHQKPPSQISAVEAANNAIYAQSQDVPIPNPAVTGSIANNTGLPTYAEAQPAAQPPTQKLDFERIDINDNGAAVEVKQENKEAQFNGSVPPTTFDGAP